MGQENLLIGITASIGVLNMPIYLQFLREEFPNLKVIMTQCSEFFIPKNSMALITDEIFTNMFPMPEKRNNSHVSLSRWADIFIVLPATAHIIAQAANGLANSLLSATILSHNKPVIFFPNMNSNMWENPATKRNVDLLKQYGHIIVSPIKQMGFEYASGKNKEDEFMPFPPEISKIIKAELAKRTTSYKEELKETSCR